MQSKKMPGLAELLYVVIFIMMFVILLLVFVHLPGYDSLVLEWIMAISLLITTLFLLTFLVIGMVVLLKDILHSYRVQRTYRDFELEIQTKRITHPIRIVRSRNHRMPY